VVWDEGLGHVVVVVVVVEVRRWYEVVLGLDEESGVVLFLVVMVVVVVVVVVSQLLARGRTGQLRVLRTETVLIRGVLDDDYGAIVERE